MTKKYMSVREYAARHMVCAATVYAMCAQGTLPHVRLGVGRGTIRIPVDAVGSDPGTETRQPEVFETRQPGGASC